MSCISVLLSFIEITCPSLTDPIQGHVTTTSGGKIGSRAEYTCNKGYLLQGEPVRICNEEGYWTGEEPYCTPIEGIYDI